MKLRLDKIDDTQEMISDDIYFYGTENPDTIAWQAAIYSSDFDESGIIRGTFYFIHMIQYTI